MRLPTDDEIERVKKEVVFPRGVDANHDHPDCVRIAYAWLDAQRKLKNCCSTVSKGHIEGWGGRYISKSNVYLAAHLHPDIIVRNRKINISRNKIKPSVSRLLGIGEAGKHPNYSDANYWYPSVENDFIASFL